MEPVSPVMPGSESIEVILGKDQPQYIPLPAVYLDSPSRPMLTRWRFSAEEREAIHNGADLVLTQLTCGYLFQPVHLQVSYAHEMPYLVND